MSILPLIRHFCGVKLIANFIVMILFLILKSVMLTLRVHCEPFNVFVLWISGYDHQNPLNEQ